MPTHHDVRCPACQKKVRLAPGFLGKRVACPYCKQIFLPTANEAKVPGAAADPSAEALRSQIARLEADLAQARHRRGTRDPRIREEVARPEEQLRAAEAQAAGLRDELAACQASCRQTTDQLEALRTERDALVNQREAAKARRGTAAQMIKSCGIALD